MKALAAQAFRFALVGALAFVVDAAAMWLLLTAGVDPLVARAIAFAPAFATNFAVNSRWTFARERMCFRQEMTRYLGVQLAGMALNYALFAALLAMVGPGRTEAFVAMALGSIMAMGFNFAGARLFAFRLAR